MSWCSRIICDHIPFSVIILWVIFVLQRHLMVFYGTVNLLLKKNIFYFMAINVYTFPFHIHLKLKSISINIWAHSKMYSLTLRLHIQRIGKMAGIYLFKICTYCTAFPIAQGGLWHKNTVRTKSKCSNKTNQVRSYRDECWWEKKALSRKPNRGSVWS